MSPSARLARVLLPLTAAETTALADRAGVSSKNTFRARRGVTVPVSAYLRLCAFAGVDPQTGETIEPKTFCGDALFWMLGIAVYAERVDRELPGDREGAKAAGVNLQAFNDIQHGKRVGTTTFLKLCRFVDKSPFAYTAEPEFHMKSDSNTLISQEAAQPQTQGECA